VEARPREVRIFETETGQTPFSDWMDELEQRDNRAYDRILARIERVEEGNFGDRESVGGGVHELKIDFGPGYRVYFGEVGDSVVLLGAGKKKTQAADIAIARARWSVYNA
jgi:putative addiction module killer protein